MSERSGKYDLSKLPFNDSPEAIGLRMQIEKASEQTHLLLKVSKNKQVLKELITNPDGFLDKISKLFDDDSIIEQELEKFIKGITKILTLIELQNQTRQELIALQAEKEDSGQSVEEKENKLREFTARIVKLTEGLEIGEKNNILKKLNLE